MPGLGILHPPQGGYNRRLDGTSSGLCRRRPFGRRSRMAGSAVLDGKDSVQCSGDGGSDGGSDRLRPLYDRTPRLHARGDPRFARAHRFDGVQFLDPSSIDESLDPRRWPASPPGGRPRALSRGRAPLSQPGAAVARAGPSGHSRRAGRELVPHVEALAALGCRHARALRGRPPRSLPHRRALARPDRRDRLGAPALTPRLEDRGIRLAIETHADLTAGELLDILERIDSDVAGVTLDTGIS